jgi:hypothetical protein
MSLLAPVIDRISAIIDKVTPDKAACERAKLELIALKGTKEMRLIEAQLQAIVT